MYFRSLNRHKGSALLEFALVLPVILLLVAGIANIGRFLWQIQIMSDAARYGVRSASALSDLDSTRTCLDLGEAAKAGALEYMTNNDEGALQKQKLSSLWAPPVAFVHRRYMFQGVIPMRQIEVKFNAIPVDENCLFCYSDFLRKVLPRVSATLDLNKNSACLSESPDDYICSGEVCSAAALQSLQR